MKKTFFLLFVTLFLMSCESDKDNSYEYWSRLVSAKHSEITALALSVPCQDVEEFEIIPLQGVFTDYFLVHPSIKTAFDKLFAELEELRSKMYEAASREGIYFDFLVRNPPLRKVCHDGKAKLVFAQDLSLEEINEELPVRYEEIKNFYNDIICTDPNDWTVFRLHLAECCFEPVPLHKTIRMPEALQKLELYNRLIERKRQLENTTCYQTTCENKVKNITCINGKPVIEIAVQ
ncbi:hypothetical protein [Sphingobacterium sp. SGR-19]|uniref:hypothetical protein n=1 Tax=Sphingobacterium sp. SGR-19 TaxID=2710886 RepID=UPI0013ECA088|nr:hypothetical protein [Sphingobacterium sp. SGR-19]NGM66145.1 hypothetical protein [Sphingobacterium sp. SGR-19]